MPRPRRQHKLEFKQQVAAYVKEHSPYEAGKEFDVSPSVAARWSRGEGLGATGGQRKNAKKAKPAAKGKTRRPHSETFANLRLAHKANLETIRNGEDLSDAIVYTWLALRSLQEK